MCLAPPHFRDSQVKLLDVVLDTVGRKQVCLMGKMINAHVGMSRKRSIKIEGEASKLR